MLSFWNYLLEERTHRTYAPEDIKYVSKRWPTFNTGAVNAQVLRLHQRFEQQLLDAGAKKQDIEGKTLPELAKLAKQMNVSLQPFLKKGRKYVPADPADLKTLSDIKPDLPDTKDKRQEIKKLKADFAKRLRADDAKLIDLEKKSLGDLLDMLKSRNISMDSKPKRKRNWEQFERDVCAGINQLFKSKFFVLTKHGQKPKLLSDNRSFKAQQVGGGTKSDVIVQHNEKEFYVECKLNFDAAEYFKFGLTIINKKLQYNHRRFIDGHTDPNEIKQIDDLFKNKINLPTVLNDIVRQPSVVESWETFLGNLKDIAEFLKTSSEYKKFATQIKLSSFPEDFQSLTNVFDLYLNHYIRKYNQLVEELFATFACKKLQSQKNEYLVLLKKKKHSASDVEGTIFRAIQDFMEEAKAADAEGQFKYLDRGRFYTIISQLKKIEVKLTVLLEKLGKDPSNFNDFNFLNDKEKLMYFFKMFVSSAGRRSKGSDTNSKVELDELGNMQICSSITLQSEALAQAITDYYVHHGNCAYIQVEDRIYQFIGKWNPFSIPKLPVFKDVLNTFNVRITVTDDLSDIRLHIRSIKSDEAMLSHFNNVSFLEHSANFLMKKIKKIEVKIK